MHFAALLYFDFCPQLLYRFSDSASFWPGMSVQFLDIWRSMAKWRDLYLGTSVPYAHANCYNLAT